jgi:hypothetical protein
MRPANHHGVLAAGESTGQPRNRFFERHTVELPLHVARSRRRVYDVGEEDQRLIPYALLLAEAQREDRERFVHREWLVSIWPRLRRLPGPHARREWEQGLMAPAPR